MTDGFTISIVQNLHDSFRFIFEDTDITGWTVTFVARRQVGDSVDLFTKNLTLTQLNPGIADLALTPTETDHPPLEGVYSLYYAVGGETFSLINNEKFLINPAP